MNALLTRLRSLPRWQTALVLVLIAELAFFGAMNPRFIDPDRLLFAMSDFVYLGIIALPLAVVMMTGGIDISFGSVASLSAIVTGVTFQAGLNIWLAVLVGLLAAAVAGLVNGSAILVTGAQPMVITLGSQFLFAGLALGASGLGGVSSFEGISGLPESFLALGGGKTLGLPNMLVIFAVLAVVAAVVLGRTSYGRQARLMGANPLAARYAGFRSGQVLLVTYLLTALAAGLVGLLLTSYVGSARADIGAGLLMPTLTLVVIGGVSMYGGEGSISGVVLATFVIGFLQQGLRFMGLSENQVAVATGAALVLVASLRWWTNHMSESWKNRRARRVGGHMTPADKKTVPAPAV